jgi:hypothetical protein
MAVVLTAGMAACGGSGGVSLLPDPTVRFVNAVPDGTVLNFFVDDDQMATNLAYLASTAGFARVEPEQRDVLVREAGTTPALWAEVFPFERNRHVLVVAFGKRDFDTEFLKRLRFTTFNIDRSIPTGNKARLIVFNAFVRMDGIEPVAIDFQNPGSNPLFRLNDIAFGGVKTFVVDSGEQTFQAQRTGTDSVYMSRTETLAAGGIYLVLVTGQEGAVGPAEPSIEYVTIQPE